MMQPFQKSPPQLWVCLFIFFVTLAVYGQVRRFDFVEYDDPEYVSENPHVRAGITTEGLIWAFTSGHAGNWHPLTWISHMVDCQLFGLTSGMHHLTNLLLHIANSLLLFLLLARLTRSNWLSAFVACMFAVHPLHVESVAWIAERKDVLSALFWILTIWAYVRYLENRRATRYLLILFSFTLGLMAKPMVVTLPLVLLLLDFWPLGRTWEARSVKVPTPKREGQLGKAKARPLFGTLLWEKVPLFALSIVTSILTFAVQRREGAVIPLDMIPASTRFANALLSYVVYAEKMFLPVNLAMFYPIPAAFPLWQIVAACVAVLGVSVLVICFARRYPYLFVGWFWYLGTLVPVIGLVQVGAQSRADRYTYIPLIGLFIMFAWGASDLIQRWSKSRLVPVSLSAMLLSACMVISWYQVQHWTNSAALFAHAVAVTPNNYVGHNGLGLELAKQGRYAEAIAHYSEALRIRPDYPEAHNNLGVALAKAGRMAEAMDHYSEALRLEPDNAATHANLAAVLNQLGRVSESVEHYSEALRIQPEYAQARAGLGMALADQGQTEQAIVELSEAVRLSPDSADVHYNLGLVFAGSGQLARAITEFSEALRLRPDDAETHYNLGTAFVKQGKLDEASAQFSEAVRLKPEFADAHNSLGAAFASEGRIEEAIAHFSEAIRINPDLMDARHNLDYALAIKTQSSRPQPRK